jgi:hypothetical protein
VRLALVLCLLVLTGAAPATPSLTAQDLIDVSEGAIDPESLTASMPAADRVAAIHKLIRAGASCNRAPSDGCEIGVFYQSPRPKDTAKSPCFRRWELYTLLFSFPIDETLHLDAKEMRSVTKLDDELIGYVGPLLEDEQELELAHVLVAQKRKLPFELILDRAMAVKAVKQYHLDAAVEYLDPDLDRSTLIGVVLDPTYEAETRTSALSQLQGSDIDQDWLTRIVSPLLADRSIDVAVTVSQMTGIRPTRPPTTDRSVFMHALSLFAATEPFDGIDAFRRGPDDGDAARTFAPIGLEIISPTGVHVDHFDPDGDIAAEIRARANYQPPLFGTDPRGQIILVGFIEVQLPQALDENACELEMDGY